MSAEQPNAEGVWVTYYQHPTTGEMTVEAAWADEISALRAANTGDSTKAALLPFGALVEVLK